MVTAVLPQMHVDITNRNTFSGTAGIAFLQANSLFPNQAYTYNPTTDEFTVSDNSAPKAKAAPKTTGAGATAPADWAAVQAAVGEAVKASSAYSLQPSVTTAQNWLTAVQSALTITQSAVDAGVPNAQATLSNIQGLVAEAQKALTTRQTIVNRPERTAAEVRANTIAAHPELTERQIDGFDPMPRQTYTPPPTTAEDVQATREALQTAQRMDQEALQRVEYAAAQPNSANNGFLFGVQSDKNATAERVRIYTQLLANRLASFNANLKK